MESHLTPEGPKDAAGSDHEKRGMGDAELRDHEGRLPPSQNTPQLAAPQAAVPRGPYRGLMPFRPEDVPCFFGRRRLTALLRMRLRKLYQAPDGIRLVSLVGAAGSGKTSLVMAGLIPALGSRFLPEGKGIRALSLQPGPYPIERLVFVLQRLLARVRPPRIRSDLHIESILRQPSESGELDGLTRFVSVLPDAATRPLLIVVDPLEDLFTLCTNPAERTLFLRILLHAAAHPERHVMVLLVMRDQALPLVRQLRDGLHLPAPCGKAPSRRELGGIIAEHAAFVPPLQPHELRCAIAEPARLAEVPIEQPLCERILRQFLWGGSSLPLLQLTLTEIWSGLVKGHPASETLDALGGVRTAIATRAHAVFDGLSPSEQRLARRALTRLAVTGDHCEIDPEHRNLVRRRRPLRELCGAEPPERMLRVLRGFAERGPGLLTLTQGTVETAVTLPDAVLEHWPALQDWVQDDRALLSSLARIEAAQRWWPERHRAKLHAEAQTAASSLMEHHAEELTMEQRLFILHVLQAPPPAERHTEASTPTPYEPARLRARDRSSLAWLPIMLTTLILTWLSQGESVLQNLNEQGVRSSGYAAASNPGSGRPPIEAPLRWRGHQGAAFSAFFTPDGRRVVTAGEDGAARIWDAKSGALLTTLSGHQGSVLAAAPSPDGALTATAGWDGTVRVWSTEPGRPAALRLVLRGHYDRIWCVTWSSDGQTLATAGGDGTAQVFSALSGEPLLVLRGHTDEVRKIAFSPDGERLATASWDGTTRLWSARTGAPLAVFTGAGKALSVAFTPDGRSLIVAGEDRGVQIVRAEPEGEAAVLGAGPIGIRAAAPSPDGTRIVTCLASGGLQVLSTEQGRVLGTFPDHGSSVRAAVFSPDGQRIAAVSGDGMIRIWRAGSL